jgi:predicted CxxxxCH...CXXCH cytochrome family protein
MLLPSFTSSQDAPLISEITAFSAATVSVPASFPNVLNAGVVPLHLPVEPVNVVVSLPNSSAFTRASPLSSMETVPHANLSVGTTNIRIRNNFAPPAGCANTVCHSTGTNTLPAVSPVLLHSPRPADEAFKNQRLPLPKLVIAAADVSSNLYPVPLMTMLPWNSVLAVALSALSVAVVPLKSKMAGNSAALAAVAVVATATITSAARARIILSLFTCLAPCCLLCAAHEHRYVCVTGVRAGLGWQVWLGGCKCLRVLFPASRYLLVRCLCGLSCPACAPV